MIESTTLCKKSSDLPGSTLGPEMSSRNAFVILTVRSESSSNCGSTSWEISVYEIKEKMRRHKKYVHKPSNYISETTHAVPEVFQEDQL